MISLRTLSIPKKIVAISMIISASALLLTSGALIGYDLVAARGDLRASTTALAGIVAGNTTAAVSFDDRAAATETLNSLPAEPSIVDACIYTAAGLFAQYVSPGNPPCPARSSSRDRAAGYELVSTPIQLQGKEIGVLELRATLAPVYARLRLEILSITVILLLSALFAWALSTRLHGLVSEPILSLIGTANQVSRQKDYSVRATKQSEDELGTLVDSFNEMLAQIQARETDLRNRTMELARANEDLHVASRMKDEFLATLSHELRTPLTAIYGWVSLLQTGGLDQAKIGKAISVIDRNVKAQTQLVDDLLNMSQIVTGKMTIHMEWTQAGTVVQAAVESIRPAATAKGIDVVMEVADPAELVFADPGRLQQVLWNLLTNAVKFTEKGGEIRVECSRIGRQLQISVSDTGPGIDPEFIPFLFERFTQADPSKTRKHGGLGLGLAIVRHIVESHGGKVMVHNREEGQGSTFIVQLPIPALRPLAAAGPASRPASLKGVRVMLVDDEFDTREMIAEGLEQHGASVVLAASADEALHVLAQQKPDILISDIGMPDMDGYELIKKIRSESSLASQDMPAVALTAYATERDKQHSLQAGYQAHLSKPIAISELVRVIADFAA
jgi:signal transduction histidine kinase